MAKDQALPPPTRSRAPGQRQAGEVAARAESHAPKPRFNLVQFTHEVRAEARKITWPSRRETWVTTVMVMIMVLITAVFFFVVDLSLSFGVTQILKLGA